MTILGADTTFGNSEAWTLQAKCRETGPNDRVWFPEKWDRGRTAKDTCHQCPVRTECLDFALRNKERAGIWGGLNTKERDLLRERRPRRPHPESCICPPCRNRRRAS